MDIKNINNKIIINNIKTSMEMENQFLSDKDISMLNDFANNKISMEDAISNFKADAISSFQKLNF